MLKTSSRSQQVVVAIKRWRYQQNELDSILTTKLLDRIYPLAGGVDEFVRGRKWIWGAICKVVHGPSVRRITCVQNEVPYRRPAGIKGAPMCKNQPAGPGRVHSRFVCDWKKFRDSEEMASAIVSEDPGTYRLLQI